MTVSSTSRIAGPFINGSVFPFAFKVFSAADLRVIRTVASTDLVLSLGLDYTVTLNGDQDNSPGGQVTLIGGPLLGASLVIAGWLAVEQGTDITNQSGFFPQVVEDALDRATIHIQELSEQVGASLRPPISDGALQLSLPNRATRATKVLAFDAAGLPVASSQTLEEIEAGAFNAASSAAQAAAALNQVEQIYDAFDDRYLGPFMAEPTSNNDGDPLQIGSLYFNTTTGKLRVYTSAGWADSAVAAPVAFSFQLFSPNGAQTDFILSPVPYSDQALFVVQSGVFQRRGIDYTLIGGNTLRLTPAPVAGIDSLQVFTFSPINYGVPDDNSIATAKIQDLAVTTQKLANAAVTPGKLSAGGPTWSPTGDVTLGSGPSNVHTSKGRHTFEDGINAKGRSTADAVDMKVQALGSVSGTNALDQAVANYFSATVAGATTFTFTNAAASGFAGIFIIELTNGGAFTVTWPTSVKWPGGTAPQLTAAGIDVLSFITDDQGVTWRGNLAIKDSK